MHTRWRRAFTTFQATSSRRLGKKTKDVWKKMVGYQHMVLGTVWQELQGYHMFLTKVSKTPVILRSINLMVRFNLDPAS